MGLLDDVRGMLARDTAPSAPMGAVDARFEQIAQSVDSRTLAQGIAEVMRSDGTPPFAQIVAQLFASGSGDQKMAMINTLLSAMSPDQRAGLPALTPGLGAAASVTGTQATSISPTAVQALAQHVEQQDAGIIDRMSAVYAAHPALVKTLGSAALMIAMRTIAQQHNG